MTRHAAPQPASHLVALDGPAVQQVASALREQGETVELFAGVAEMEAAVAASARHVVLLDLSGDKAAAASKRLAGGAGKRSTSHPAADPAEPARPAPFVIALTPKGSAAQAPPLSVDLCLPANDVARAVREVRGALALRRLAALQGELDVLRAAVLHARRTAHDLAQPLTTIMARAQMLAGRLKPDDPNARPIGIICEESDRLARLIAEFQRLREMTAAASGGQAD